jgi:hypothetical protein
MLKLLGKIEFLKNNSIPFYNDNYQKIKDLVVKWILEIKILYLHLIKSGNKELLSIEK